VRRQRVFVDERFLQSVTRLRLESMEGLHASGLTAELSANCRPESVRVALKGPEDFCLLCWWGGVNERQLGQDRWTPACCIKHSSQMPATMLAMPAPNGCVPSFQAWMRAHLHISSNGKPQAPGCSGVLCKARFANVTVSPA
jgi:hypothetical protein